MPLLPKIAALARTQRERASRGMPSLSIQCLMVAEYRLTRFPIVSLLLTELADGGPRG